MMALDRESSNADIPRIRTWGNRSVLATVESLPSPRPNRVYSKLSLNALGLRHASGLNEFSASELGLVGLHVSLGTWFGAPTRQLSRSARPC